VKHWLVESYGLRGVVHKHQRYDAIVGLLAQLILLSMEKTCLLLSVQSFVWGMVIHNFLGKITFAVFSYFSGSE
jgi:hypothetical protein